MFLKVFLWASFFTILAFFTHKQISTEVIAFEEKIFIPGVSKTEVFDFIKNVEVSMKYNTDSHSVIDIVHIFGDGEEPDKIKFNHLENVSIQGFYNQVIETPCVASLFPSIPKIQLDINVLEGLIVGSVSIAFKDASQEGKPGTFLTEYFEIITPHFFARFASEETKSAHRRFLENVKLHFKDRT